MNPGKRGRRLQRKPAATVFVTWGCTAHTLSLTSRNWRKVRAGHPLRIRGKGYYYEGEFFWDYWEFNFSGPGTVKVTYGEDGGEGWEGQLEEALVTDHFRNPPGSA